MKKILIPLILIMSISSLFAVATVKDFYGKVKVKYDGDTKWSRIVLGQELPANATVSTGFNSQIVLDLGNATLDVLPLTRMTISEITESQDTIKTSLFLQGGKISADVGKVEGKVNDFKIKSPVATASVRGTAFTFSGKKLQVIRGKVAFTPTKKRKTNNNNVVAQEASEENAGEAEEGAGVAVRAGGESQMASAGSRPVSPGQMAENKTSVKASTKPPVVKNPNNSPVTGEVKSDAPTPSFVSSTTVGIAHVTISVNISEQ